MLVQNRTRASPQRVVLLGVASVLLCLIVGLATASVASATPTEAEEWTGQITDTQGVPLENYRTLPLDRGDVFTSQKMLPAALMDLVWGAHMGMVQFVFPLLRLLLSFEWVEWVAAPVNILAENIQQFTSQIYWIPVAAMILGAAAALWVIRGRTGAGLTELLIGSLMLVLAGGLLANPVTWITGPDGVFAKAQEYGGQAAVDITADPDNPPPANMPIDEALNHTILSQLTDLFVRVPAQSVTFGAPLGGECDEIYTDNMSTADPLDSADTTVRDRVSSCDDSAKTYVESSALLKVFPVLIVAGGGGILILLALFMAIAFFLAVVMTLYHGVKQMISVLIAILPGTSRRGFFRSFIAVVVYGLLVGLQMVVIASYLMVLVSVAKATAPLGITLQMGLVIILVVVLIVLLCIIWKRSVKSGQRIADRLARLGLGGDGPTPQPAKFNPISKIEPYVRDAVNRKLLTSNIGSTRDHPQVAPPQDTAQKAPAGRPFTAPSTAPAAVSLPSRAPQRALPPGHPRSDDAAPPGGPTGSGPRPGQPGPTGRPPATGAAPRSAKALRALSSGLSLVGGPTAMAGGLVARGTAGVIEHRTKRSDAASSQETPAAALPGGGRSDSGPAARAQESRRAASWVSPEGRRIEVDTQGRGRVTAPPIEGRIVPNTQGPTRPPQRAMRASSFETQAMRRQIARARMAAAARSAGAAR